MKTKKILFTFSLLAMLSAAAYGQSFNVADGDWHVPANWSTGLLPTSGTNPIINNSRTANITAGNPAALADILRVGNQDSPTAYGQLNIAGDLTATRNIQIASGLNSEGYVTQSAGMVTFGNNFQVASNSSGSVAEYMVSGGTLSGSTGNIAVGTQGIGLFHVSGNSANISAGSMNIGEGATMQFTFAEAGVTSIDLTAGLNITEGASLLIDGAAFTGSVIGEIELFKFATINGSFGENVTFQNFGSLNPQLSQVGGSLMVIPEPRIYALALGLLAFAWIALRRRSGRS
jgi:hypothetical protein